MLISVNQDLAEHTGRHSFARHPNPVAFEMTTEKLHTRSSAPLRTYSVIFGNIKSCITHMESSQYCPFCTEHGNRKHHVQYLHCSIPQTDLHLSLLPVVPIPMLKTHDSKYCSIK